MTQDYILIVDDEPKLVRLVTEVLRGTGYKTIACSNGEQVLEMVSIEQPDLVILDIVLLGNLDGYAIAQRLREFSNIPIIMLTAKIRESDMLRGFECGIDDYITKPFSAKELLARVRSVLNRSRGTNQPLTESEIICGELRINLPRRQVTIADREVHLTPTEYKLLYELAKHRNRVILHEPLLIAVWGDEYRQDIDYLRAYIHYLRRKLEPDPANPRLIVSSPGVGYMLVDPDIN